ncbi:MAG: hypothetical protein IPH16_00865 [Haliscomenobacter sp.]|nr:hypothetical protein [Haliscomenobacter sp.]MBK7477174.1 hypothetical protein [Haliscomenobacter sp.]MBK8878671.1 hypothetical protein [Haliscomenobacter sp.]
MNGYKILASGISNLTDARFFAAWEADWLAFELDPSSEAYLPPAGIAAIKDWVQGPAIAGAAGLLSAAEILTLCRDLALDAVIAPMALPLETQQELSASLPVLKEIVVEPSSTEENLEEFLESFAPWTAYFVFNLSKNRVSHEVFSHGRPLSEPWFAAICAQYPILLQTELEASGIKDILNTSHPAGFCFQGGAEEKTGFKSFDELDELLEMIRNR